MAKTTYAERYLDESKPTKAGSNPEMGRRKARSPLRGAKTRPKAHQINREAQAVVVQAYWNKDQDCKRAKAQRDKMHGIALLAVPLGTTAGPAQDEDGMAHWLTHGEKERAELDTGAVYDAFIGLNLHMHDILSVMQVDVAKLRESWPGVYIKLLKHRSTRRSTHDVLTWAEKRPAPVRKRVRS